jgi:hypothetical protein
VRERALSGVDTGNPWRCVFAAKDKWEGRWDDCGSYISCALTNIHSASVKGGELVTPRRSDTSQSHRNARSSPTFPSHTMEIWFVLRNSYPWQSKRALCHGLDMKRHT